MPPWLLLHTVARRIHAARRIVDENFVTSITGDKATIATRVQVRARLGQLAKRIVFVTLYPPQRYAQTLPAACSVPNASSCLNWAPNASNPSDDV
jgi:hypothetical protein